MGKASRPKPKRLAEKLKQIRLNFDLSQSQMIKLLNFNEAELTQNSLTNIELGKREPNLLLLLRYARVGKVSFESIVDDEMELELLKRNQ